MKKLFNWIKYEFADFKLLVRNVPATAFAFFAIAVVLMNLMASKTILNLSWLALDGGLIIAWLPFMSMDVITKHFGPRAATKLSIFATVINLMVCGIFAILTYIPGTWSTGWDNKIANDAVNTLFAGSWQVLLSSTIAFIASAFINNFLNAGIGKLFVNNPDSKSSYVTRTYVSTVVGQFFDNIIFNMLFQVMFIRSWTPLQALTCALTGAIVELIMEIIFSPIGYRITVNWKNSGVGKEYLESQFYKE